MLARLAALPPVAVYSILAALTAIENIFPPTPSDVAVALGAFLSHYGVTTPGTVFLVAWGANVIGAVVVYVAARRYGQRFLATPLGRRLLPRKSIELMEREYVRFGVAGIVLARLFPGFRSFVAPFVGLIGLSVARAIVPIALASGAWYAALTLAGSALGSEWETINRLITGLNRTLGVLGGGLAAALVVWLLIRRQRRPERHRLWNAVHRAFGHDLVREEAERNDPAVASAADLLLALARTETTLAPDELRAIDTYLQHRWGLETTRGDGDEAVDDQSDKPLDLARFRSRIVEQYERFQRVHLAERLWRVAFADGVLSRHEELLMGRVAELLGLDAEDVARARRRAEPRR
ncbi:MAG TPA: TerB family tellurite resistance protein [Gemmatimonadales bacterium]|nr:TerB family tellurite resistance protein [Gemmatimonadales bacterium]